VKLIYLQKSKKYSIISHFLLAITRDLDSNNSS